MKRRHSPRRKVRGDGENSNPDTGDTGNGGSGMKKAERKKLISSLDAYENAERYWREAVGNGSLPGTPLLDSITCGIGAALGSNLFGKH